MGPGVAVRLLESLQRGNKKRRRALKYSTHIFQMRSLRITQTYFTGLKMDVKLPQCLIN
jgi:hypothetical protein